MEQAFALLTGLAASVTAAVLVLRHATQTKRAGQVVDAATRDALESDWANRTAITFFVAVVIGTVPALLLAKASIWLILVLAAFYVFFLGPVLLISAEAYRPMVFPEPRPDTSEE